MKVEAMGGLAREVDIFFLQLGYFSCQFLPFHWFHEVTPFPILSYPCNPTPPKTKRSRERSKREREIDLDEVAWMGDLERKVFVGSMKEILSYSTHPIDFLWLLPFPFFSCLDLDLDLHNSCFFLLYLLNIFHFELLFVICVFV